MEGTIGEVRLFAALDSFVPKNWMLCAGQLLEIQANVQLFSVMGNSYGGDGRANFRLPDLNGKSPMQLQPTQPQKFGNYIVCVKGFYPDRQT